MKKKNEEMKGIEIIFRESEKEETKEVGTVSRKKWWTSQK